MLRRRGFLRWMVAAAGILAGLGRGGPVRAGLSGGPSPTRKPGARVPASPPKSAAAASPAADETAPPAALARAAAAWLASVLPKAKLTQPETLAVARAVQDGLGIDAALRDLPRRDLPAPDFVFAADGQMRP